MDSYDFIVVGAGTAGCVLAARLSEDEGARVLLLEAGARQPLEAMAVPPAWPTLLGSSADWADMTVPQGASGTPIPSPRGRALGGSSAINAMFFARGHRSSYDAWPTAGAKGWAFDDLLPYFRRSERTEGRDPAVRGVDGPMVVGPAVPRHPLMETGLTAAAELGHPEASDFSSGLEEGFGRPDLSILDGRRLSAADAYLAPALGRPGLDVLTGAFVHRLTIDGGRCTGVEFSVGAELLTVTSRREVVLSAGAIGSAQLLLLSGIGPEAHLAEVGIDVVLHLPGVGGNLQDHPLSMIAYRPAQPVPPSVHNHGGTMGLVRSEHADDGPDIQILFSDIPLYGPALQGPEGVYAIAFSAVRPRSRGTVRLASAEPGAAPLVDPRYYSDPHDLDVMTDAFRITRAIGQADAFAPWRDREVLPGPEVDDGAGIREYLSKSLMTYFHPVGSCRIGEDEHAVVDPDLHVRGVDGLRIADASVMPALPSANTNSTVYAIAERAADLIRR